MRLHLAILSAILVSLVCSLSSSGQISFPYNALSPPDTYRAENSPYYWKNRPPTQNYWQQDVHYFIEAKLDGEKNIISGSENLTYWNNSPDTLYEVYFHLYQNAYTPDSYYMLAQKAIGNKPALVEYEAEGLGTEIHGLILADDKGNEFPCELSLDNTILKVKLPFPLLPNNSVRFDIAFSTYFSNSTTGRRMHYFEEFGQKVFKGVLWYPRIALYDRKFGWNIDQHLGQEFNGDFGTFDVELTLPNDYINEATGKLQNENIVLPDDLKAAIDIKNFAHKRLGSYPSTILKMNTTEHKTWIYHAENVHDFAFVCSPLFRRSVLEKNGVEAVAMVLEPNAPAWQNAAEYAAKTIEVFSESIGKYAYPKIVVADARDGMEYPMITLDDGIDADYRSLLVHEIGHMWFYGMVGNNETYRPFLDEGFTQYITALGLEKIDGIYLKQNPRNLNGYQRSFLRQEKAREQEVFGYVTEVLHDVNPIIDQHSDHFNEKDVYGKGYWSIYEKTASMLYSLQYMLGDSLFFGALHHYFNQWKFCHPYTEDMQKSFEDYTQTDLSWFFDQWLRNDISLDYKVLRPKRKKNKNYLLRFERVGDMELPLHVYVTNKKNDTLHYFIPTSHNIPLDSSTNILPQWWGWNEKNRRYATTVKLPFKPYDVMIDPEGVLADVNGLNNHLRRRKSFHFDHLMYQIPDRFHYEIRWRPDIWYNQTDGLQFGINLNGDYLRTKHIFSLSAWYNSGLLNNGNIVERNFWYNFSYETPLKKLSPDLGIRIKSRFLEGVSRHNVSIYRKNAYQEMRITVNSLQLQYNFRKYAHQANLPYLTEVYNNTLQLLWRINYTPHAQVQMEISSPILFSDYDFSYANITHTASPELGAFITHTRLFAQVGTGNNIPIESALFVGGANPETWIENKFYRSAGIFPADWTHFDSNIGHLQHSGGLNLRAYNSLFFNGNYAGLSGAAANVEIELKSLRQALHFGSLAFSPYVFADIGSLFSTNNQFFDSIKNNYLYDGGAGLRFSINRWGVFEKAKPLHIAFEVPLFYQKDVLTRQNEQFNWFFKLGYDW
ncbi:MAG: M1 family metallopeptidase [Bacteroidetes bacterium]|nr:M1 family metallopeptidase [Bacteroidota bacterium]MCB9043289.1 M1 family metallopeptidase [Chitinophagales bacterium]